MDKQTVNFNVRMVPADVARKLMTLAKKAGTRRENYIRKLFELHVDQADRDNQIPGRYVIKAPTHEKIARRVEATKAEA